uniref:Cylicin 1 n=1 Tax=Catagonus wagneri TaxID=51154 RepID=A0A8C3VMB1_9CETA
MSQNITVEEVNIRTYDNSIPISESSRKLWNQQYLTFPNPHQPGRRKRSRSSELQITVPRHDKRNLKEVQKQSHIWIRHSLRKKFQRSSISLTVSRQVSFGHPDTPIIHPKMSEAKKSYDKKGTTWNKVFKKDISPHGTTLEYNKTVNYEKPKRRNKVDKIPSKSSHESELFKKSKSKSEINPEYKESKSISIKGQKKDKRDSKFSRDMDIESICTKKYSKSSKNNYDAKSEACSKNSSNMDLMMYLEESGAEFMEFDIWLKNHSQNNSKKPPKKDAKKDAKKSSDAESVDSKDAKKDKKNAKKDNKNNAKKDAESTDAESGESKDAKKDSKKAKKDGKKKDDKKNDAKKDATSTDAESVDSKDAKTDSKKAKKDSKKDDKKKDDKKDTASTDAESVDSKDAKKDSKKTKDTKKDDKKKDAKKDTESTDAESVDSKDAKEDSKKGKKDPKKDDKKKDAKKDAMSTDAESESEADAKKAKKESKDRKDSKKSDKNKSAMKSEESADWESKTTKGSKKVKQDSKKDDKKGIESSYVESEESLYKLGLKRRVDESDATFTDSKKETLEPKKGFKMPFRRTTFKEKRKKISIGRVPPSRVRPPLPPCEPLLPSPRVKRLCQCQMPPPPPKPRYAPLVCLLTFYF